MLSIRITNSPKRRRCRRCNRRDLAVDVLQGVDGAIDCLRSVLCGECASLLLARVSQNLSMMLDKPGQTKR